jgi:flavodoxin
METIVIYDSKYGNTEKIARTIGESIGAQVRLAGDTQPADLKEFNVLIVGSPTHGGFPSEAIHNLLKAMSALEGIDTAAFDTRTKTTIFGYAAPKIAKSLKKKGANLLLLPEGFFVLGTEGPLMDGELERATEWAKKIVNIMENRNA